MGDKLSRRRCLAISLLTGSENFPRAIGIRDVKSLVSRDGRAPSPSCDVYRQRTGTCRAEPRGVSTSDEGCRGYRTQGLQLPSRAGNVAATRWFCHAHGSAGVLGNLPAHGRSADCQPRGGSRMHQRLLGPAGGRSAEPHGGARDLHFQSQGEERSWQGLWFHFGDCGSACCSDDQRSRCIEARVHSRRGR